MVKSLSTIYIESSVLEEARVKKLPVSRICEEALRASLGANSGSVEGALGNMLNHKAEMSKDIEVLKRLSKVREEKYTPQTKARHEAFGQGLTNFANKYKLTRQEALEATGLNYTPIRVVDDKRVSPETPSQKDVKE